MPNRSRDKGSRTERAVVGLFRAAGLEAYRVPLSGSTLGFKSDVEVRLGHQTVRLESKVRSRGFRNIYRWLAGNDGLVIKADHEQALLVISLERLTSLLATLPHNPIETAPSKTSEDSTLKSPQDEPQSISFSTAKDQPTIQSTTVYINPPRLEPLRVANSTADPSD